MEPAAILEELYIRYLHNECSAEEIRMLMQLFGVAENEEVLKSLIRQQLVTMDGGSATAQEEMKGKLNGAYQKVLERLHAQAQSVKPVVPLLQRRSFWLSAAAILLLAVSSVVFFYGNRERKQELAGWETPGSMQSQDIAPGGNRAVLVLADGSQVVLDSADEGALARQGAAEVIKLSDGQLAYKVEGGEDREPVFNTIVTPRGGQYQVVLPDGSRVWLNAASSLRFPTAFAGSERRVEVSGEAYFEVAHHAQKPFYVSVPGMEVRVLGTHFNINAYADESTINTSLIQGSIKVIKGPVSEILKPGQQSRLEKSGTISVVNDVDMEDVMAWRNGRFRFGEAMDIAMIMRQLARWYDIEVEYKTKVTGRIGGTISRDVNISKVLKMLEMTGAVKFQLNGRKVHVMPG